MSLLHSDHSIVATDFVDLNFGYAAFSCHWQVWIGLALNGGLLSRAAIRTYYPMPARRPMPPFTYSIKLSFVNDIFHQL